MYIDIACVALDDVDGRRYISLASVKKHTHRQTVALFLLLNN